MCIFNWFIVNILRLNLCELFNLCAVPKNHVIGFIIIDMHFIWTTPVFNCVSDTLQFLFNYFQIFIMGMESSIMP